MRQNVAGFYLHITYQRDYHVTHYIIVIYLLSLEAPSSRFHQHCDNLPHYQYRSSYLQSRKINQCA